MKKKFNNPFMLAICFSLLLILQGGTKAYPEVIRVPQDIADLQQAIDASDEDATIRVAAGTYYGNFHLSGKRRLIGEDPQNTVLTDDGEGPPDAIITINGDCTLSGFMITGARGGGLGHAVVITRGSPSVTNNIIRDNSFTALGIHSEAHLTIARIYNNKIYGNGGAGIANYGQYSRSLIEYNEIHSNTNAGIVSIYFAAPTIKENHIHHNGVGIVVRDDAKAVITMNNISANNMVGIVVTSSSAARIVGNSLVGNGTVGINVDRQSTAEIFKNTVTDNGAEAIYFKGKSEGVVDSNDVSGILPTVVHFDKSRVRISNNSFYSMESPRENAVLITDSSVLMGNNEIIGGAEVKDSIIIPLKEDQIIYKISQKPFWESETGLPLDLLPAFDSPDDNNDDDDNDYNDDDDNDDLKPSKPKPELRLRSCWGIF